MWGWCAVTETMSGDGWRGFTSSLEENLVI